MKTTKRINDTYDSYHDRLTKYRIFIQIILITFISILTGWSILTVYLLNGFGIEWEFQKATNCNIQIDNGTLFGLHGVSYSYEVNGKSYKGFQPIDKNKVTDISTYQIYYNLEYPSFNYISSYYKIKLSDIKTTIILFDCLLLYFFLLPFILHYIPTATQIRDRRWKKKYENQ
jgi:hypothetical protein